MNYKCIKPCVTEFASYKVGDIVSEMVAEKYEGFFKEDGQVQAPVVEVVTPVAAVEEPKEEILTEVSSQVSIEVETAEQE